MASPENNYIRRQREPALPRDDTLVIIEKVNCLSANDPVLKELSDEEIVELILDEGYNLLDPFPNVLQMKEEADERDIFVSPFNDFYRCKTAYLSEDQNHLVSPYSKWEIGSYFPSSILARQEYKDHWNTIYNHFIVEGSTQQVILNGTAGCGKSVEGFFILNRIFASFPDNPPPILYAASETSYQALGYFRGFSFQIYDHHVFQQSMTYKVMIANGPVWHIYDSTCPSNGVGWRKVGPQIFICSSEESFQNKLKPILKTRHLSLSLALPSIAEMHIMRDLFFGDRKDDKDYISATRMLSLIDRFGRNPRTIFEFGNSPGYLENVEKELDQWADFEDLGITEESPQT